MPLSEDAQYQTLGTIRNQEIATRWSICSLFLAIHTGGIFLVLTILPEFPDKPLLYKFTCGFGLLFAGIWFFLLQRIHHWDLYWSKRLSMLETKTQLPVFGEEMRHESRKPFPFPIHVLLSIATMIFGGIWIVPMFV